MTKPTMKTNPKEAVNRLIANDQNGFARVRFPTYEKKLAPARQCLNYSPRDLTMAICQYVRGASSRGEFLFRTKFLLPFIKHHIKAPNELYQDPHGNIMVKLGGDLSSHLFVAHVDTVNTNKSPPYQDLIHDVETDTLKTGGIPMQTVMKINKHKVYDMGVERTIEVQTPFTERFDAVLGADDGVGVAILLHMIRSGVKGHYLFVRGEEIGCQGTALVLEDGLVGPGMYEIAVQIDRKGTNEIINEMSPGKTASKEFAEELGKALGMGHQPSPKGSITDVGKMADIINECVNIAAGYEDQHSDRESCNLKYVDKLAEAMCKVKWDELTPVREPGDKVREADKLRGQNQIWDAWGGGYRHPTTRNAYGDYNNDNIESRIPLDRTYHTISEVESWVRRNSGFLAMFLAANHVAPHTLHELIQRSVDDTKNKSTRLPNDDWKLL